MSFLSKNKNKTPERRRRTSDDAPPSFRRSQTITGSTSTKVNAAGESRTVLQSERLRQQALKKKRQFILSLVILFIIFLGGIVYAISQYIPGARSLEYGAMQFNVKPDEKIYLQTLQDYLDRTPGQRFNFALNDANLEQFVIKKHPEVRSLESNGGGDFTIDFREPIAVWVVNNEKNYVDKNGDAFKVNYYLEPSLSVTDKSGVNLPDGSVLASQGFLRFIGRTVALFNESGLGKVTEIVLPPNTTRQVDIKLEGRGYVIKTHTNRDPLHEVEDLKRVVGYLEGKKINPVYIDIRIPGKAYYR